MDMRIIENVNPFISVVNVVLSASLGSSVDIKKAASRLDEVSFSSAGFPGVVLRLERPRVAVLIFRSGKMICSGARSEAEATVALDKAISLLASVHATKRAKPSVRVVNIVASVDLGSDVNLEGSFEVLPKSIYEPDQFPALLYQMERPKVSFIIFCTGKMVCTGAKTRHELVRAVKKLARTLARNRLLIQRNN